MKGLELPFDKPETDTDIDIDIDVEAEVDIDAILPALLFSRDFLPLHFAEKKILKNVLGALKKIVIKLCNNRNFSKFSTHMLQEVS